MPLLNVPGTRSGDSLPSELRSGVKEYCGTPVMPSLRLSASGAGLSGMSVWYGASEGPWGYRAYNWPPFGYRGMSGLGQTCDPSVAYSAMQAGCNCVDNGDGTFTCFPTGGDSTGGMTCQPDDSAPLGSYLTYCSTGLPINAATLAQGGTSLSQASGITNVNIGGATVPAQHPPAYTGAVTCAAGQNCGTAPSGYQWVPVINQAGQTLAQVLSVAQGGGYTVNTKTGQTTVTGTPGMPTTGAQAPTFSAGLFTNPTSMVLILGAGLLLVMMMQSGKK